ncbi:MAG: enoyl-CoA hydratase-related protein [Acidimicrobiia bacterium]|nr:enoyl-CoA hydratase-related protein [Acidimicrobiia bacterium]
MTDAGVDYATILLDVDGPVAKITLNRPDRLNAWNWRMDAEMHHAFHRLDNDDAIRAIVVTGSGRAFCAGADLGGGGDTFAGTDKSTVGTPKEWYSLYPSPRTPPHDLATPVIAAINGAAVGAGLTMPITFDLRYAAEDAKLGFVFNRRGIMPDADILWTVPRMIGFARGLDLLLTGRIFSGAEAAEWGLVSRAAPRDEVLEVAMEAAHDIATNTAPVSVAITKKLAYRFLRESDQAEAGRLQADLFAWTGRQADAAEGVMAFLEKREPEWKLSKTADLPDAVR